MIQSLSLNIRVVPIENILNLAWDVHPKPISIRKIADIILFRGFDGRHLEALTLDI